MRNAKYNSHLPLLKVAHGSVKNTFPHCAISSHILSPTEALRLIELLFLPWRKKCNNHFLMENLLPLRTNLQQPSKVKVTA